MSCNCSNFDGGVDRHANSYVDNEDISFENADGDDVEFEGDDYITIGDDSHHDNLDGLDYGSDFDDEDFEGGSGYESIGSESQHSFAFDGEAEYGDGEFDDFLTRRSRARRKLRKKYRKSGMSRKEARKKAVGQVPKQKLGKLLSHAVRGKTDPETKKILDNLKEKGVIDPKKDGIDKVASQIEESMNENVSEGTQNMGTETPTTAPSGMGGTTGGTTTAGVGGKGKKMKMLLVVGVVAVVGFVLWRKFKG